MHIVSAADESFVPHFCAMLHSAWLFHPDAAYTLIACSVAESTRSLLADFAAARRIALDIVPLDPSHVEDLPIRPGLTTATYARLFIDALLPDALDRTIYLDADITLNGRLDALFGIDMRGMPLAAAPDIEDSSANERLRLGMPAGAHYFNAGVFLADLAMWRQERIGSRIANFARTAAEALTYLDQSAINAVLEGRILPIARTFNAFDPSHFDEIADPVVIHHTAMKPWHAEWHAFHELYRFHRNNTPWPLGRSRRVGPQLRYLRRHLGAHIGIPRYRKLLDKMRSHHALRLNVGLPALERAHALLAGKPRVAQGMAYTSTSLSMPLSETLLD